MSASPRYLPKLALSLLLISQTAALAIPAPGLGIFPKVQLTALGEKATAGDAEAAGQIFDRAIATADNIEEVTAKIDVLADIAVKLAEVGETTRSQQLFERTIELSKQSRENFTLHEQEQVWRDLSVKMVQAGFTGQGLQFSKRILTDIVEAEALNNIATVLIAKGQPEVAKTTLVQAVAKAKSITGEYAYESNGSCGNDKFALFAKIAVNLSALSQLEQALQSASNITNCSSANGESGQEYQTWAFMGILTHLANAQQLNQTWQVAQTAPDAEVWSAIAVKSIDLGELELAQSVADKLAADIPTIKTIDSGFAGRKYGIKEYAQRRIAVKFAEAGKFERALQIAKTIYNPTSEEIKSNETLGRFIQPSIQDLTTIDIASQFAKNNQLESGLQLVDGLTEQYSKSAGIIAIAKSLQSIGQTETAEKLLSESLQLPPIPAADDYNNNKSMIDLAGSLASIGKVDRGLEIARSLKNGSYKQDAIAQIATQLASLGQLEQSLKIANTLIGSGWREYILSEIATKFIKLDQPESALKIIQSLSEESKQYISFEIAESFTKQGKTAQALQIAETLTDRGNKSLALANIAAKYLSNKS
mgnify:CR=1 FL=1